MTKAIPAWSTNLAVNIPKDERALLGRLSVRFGARSVGALVKELIALGLAQKDAAAAQTLKGIRAQYYPALHLALLVFVGLHSCLDPQGMQRRGRRVRTAACVRAARGTLTSRTREAGAA